MQYPSWVQLPQQRQRIGMGLPVVDDDWQAQLLGQQHLLAEQLHLPFLRRIFRPVIVQSDLPDSPALGVSGQGFQLFQIVFGGVPRLLRVDAGGKVHKVVPFRQFARGVARGQIGPYGHYIFHALPVDAFQQFVPVGIEPFVIVVGVGIKYPVHGFSFGKKRGRRQRCCPGPAIYILCSRVYQHSFAPAGIASSSIKRCRLSPCSAEISMPLDSRPIILRGARLVHATTVLPTSSSGL